MLKTKIIAVFLSITTVFTVFMGVSFAESGDDTETLVIENGKLISGNSELIDSGYIVLGSPEEDTSADAENQDKAPTEEDVKFVLDSFKSMFKDVNNGGIGGVSVPQQNPSAQSPLVPSQTPGAIEDIPSIDYTIALDSTVPSAQIFTVTATDLGNSGGAASDPNGYGYEFFGQSFRYDYPSHNSKAWMDAYNGYGYDDFYNPAGLHYNKTRIVIGQTTNANGLVSNNWNIVIAGGKTLEYTTSYAGKGLARAYNSLNAGIVFNIAEKYTPMFDVANGTLRMIGPSATSPFVLDANGFVQANRVQAPIVYVGANGKAEFKNVRFQDSLLDTATTYRNEMFINGAAIFVNGGELHLENVTFYNCETSSARNGNGGAIFIQDGIVTIKNCNFGGTGSQQDLWATQGGALYIKGNNTVVTMEGGSAVNCHAINGSTGPRGGFAYMYSGTFNVKNVTIGSTTAVAVGGASGLATAVEAHTGGAFYMSSLSTLNIQDSTIQNCKSFQNSTMEVGGGGIYVNDYDTLTPHEGVYNDTPSTTVNLKNTTIKGCVAETDGGGIFAHGGQINIEGGSITDNRVEYTTTNVCIDAARTGGGIYAAYKAEINLDGVTVTGNSAYRGGGVYITRQATVNMESGSISSSKIGGGVYLFSSGTFNLNGGTMSGNQFTSRNTNHTSLYDGNSFGTAVVMQGEGTNYPTFNMSDGTISGHTNTTNTTSATGSKNLNYGGAVGSMAGGYINISGGTISGNSAGVGGGIYAIDGCTITMTGGTISNNSATISTTNAGGGGGIFAGAGTNVYIKAGTIEGNSSAVAAGGGGGGISVNTPTHFFIGDENDTTRCPQIKNNTAVCDGGGVYAITSGIIISNCEISGNTAKHGGGVYVTNSISGYSVTMHNGKIDSNSSSGVFLAGSAATSFVMNGGSISGNTIVKEGGHDYGGAGICSLNGHSVTINGGTIDGNKNLDEDVFTTEAGDTAMHGGGIAMVQSATTSAIGTLTITGGTISNNETTGNGGGIYSEDGGIVSIKGTANSIVTISGNTAKGLKEDGGGGGIYFNQNKGASTAGSAVPIEYAVIDGNKATGLKSDGGGIRSHATNINMSHCTVSNNELTDTGGGTNGGGMDFSNNGYTLTMDNCTFNNNSTNKWGGGLYCGGGVIATINKSSFCDNYSEQGGGIDGYNMATITLTNSYVSGNRSYAGGGIAIHTEQATRNTTLTVKDCYIGKNLDENGQLVDKGNTATNLGGGIYVGINCTLNLDGVNDFSNNTARNGGGVYFSADVYLPEFKGATLSNNKTTTGNGGGIYATRTTASNTEGQRLTLSYCTMEGNTAGGNGGAVYAANTVLTVNNGEGAGQSVMRGNKAGGSGGAVYLINNTGAETGVTNFFKLSGTLYENNEANTDSTGEDGFGGAIYVANGNGYVTNNEFYSNSVKASPANDSGVITDGNGGAVYVSGTSAVNSLLEFSINTVGAKDKGNTADNLGGGLCIGPYTKAAILRGYFMYNTASAGGGLHAADCVGGLLITPYTDDMKTHLGYTTIYSGVDKLTVDASRMFTAVQGNNAATYGGGIHVTGGTAQISNVAITGNTASYGGGLNVLGNSAVTLTNAAICDNTAQNGSGAGVYVGPASSVTVNGGYIVGNSAKGSFSGNTTMGVDAVGVGGGVAVFDGGQFYLNLSGKNGAIYGNTASVGANDVFANGASTTKLKIPAAADMDLDGATIGGASVSAYTKDVSKSAWWEDYKTGDNNYTNGLAGDIPPAFRYADGPVSVRAFVTSAEGTSPSGRYVNDDNAFVSITFDVQKYNVGSILITAPASADADQRFVFTVTGTTIRNEMVSFTLSLTGGQTAKIEKLYPGTYTVTQNTAWSWRYEIGGLTLDGVSKGATDFVQVQIKGTSVTEEYSVAYTNTLTNNRWLDDNSPVESNKPTFTAVARIDLAESKKSLIF